MASGISFKILGNFFFQCGEQMKQGLENTDNCQSFGDGYPGNYRLSLLLCMFENMHTKKIKNNKATENLYASF